MRLFDRIRDGLGVQRPLPDADDQAIARYRYLLQTAPPETIEQAHAEAFAHLTPEQLARVATRAEIRQPGVLERVFGAPTAASGMAGPGMGSVFTSGFLSSMAGTVLGSMIAQHFMSSHPASAGLLGDAISGPGNPPSFWSTERASASGDRDVSPAAADDVNIAGDDTDISDPFDSDIDGGPWDA